MEYWKEENLLGKGKDAKVMSLSWDVFSMRKLLKKRMNLSVKDRVETRPEE